jgi:hypothetical protein
MSPGIGELEQGGISLYKKSRIQEKDRKSKKRIGERDLLEIRFFLPSFLS